MTGPARTDLRYQDLAYRFDQLMSHDRLVEQTARTEQIHDMDSSHRSSRSSRSRIWGI